MWLVERQGPVEVSVDWMHTQDIETELIDKFNTTIDNTGPSVSISCMNMKLSNTSSTFTKLLFKEQSVKNDINSTGQCVSISCMN